MPKSSKPQVKSFRDVLEVAGPRPSPDSPAPDKNRYAMAFANSMPVLIANALRPHFPGIKPDPSGKGVESPARASRGLKKLDVNYGTPSPARSAHKNPDTE